LVSFNNLFDRKSFVYTIEQLTLLILIIGRWMLPKGIVSRDQLSQLLLVFFGISFDIMELFHLFDEPVIIANRTMQYVILAIWTGSLLQFTIVLTTTKTRRQRLPREMRGGHGLVHRMTQWRCCHTEIWGLLVMIILQDGPFLVLRLYCFSLCIFGYSLLFYTVKNVLIIVLEVYRCTVLVLRCLRPGFDERQPHQEPSLTAFDPLGLDTGCEGETTVGRLKETTVESTPARELENCPGSYEGTEANVGYFPPALPPDSSPRTLFLPI